MPYILIRNGKTLQHYIMLGNSKKNWKRDVTLSIISFETLEAANEVAKTIDASVKKVA
jgi:hypothetical protein